MADSIEQVIYSEAQRGLALQPVLVNELRARTGVLLAVTTAVTSFLGALAIDHGGLRGWGVGALAAFIAAVGFCVAVFWPRKWIFHEAPGSAVAQYCDKEHPDGRAWTVEQVQRDLALHMGEHADDAADKMASMQKLMLAGGAALAVDVTCWLIEYGT